MRCGGPSNGSGPMDMPKLAIVAALEREVRPLVKTWHVNEKVHDDRRYRFFEHGETVLVCAGIGATPARRASEAIITIFEPEVVWSVGFAGALDSKFQVGDILHPRTVINASDGSTAHLDTGEGVLISFLEVATPAQKAKLRESYGANAVDMEASAVARSAESRGIQFKVIKAISDDADFDLPPMERFVNPDGTFSEVRFGLFAVIRPWLWSHVLRLASNSRKASQALCQHLKKEIL
jgi:adenosylhomocysteine nucleosidase